eukprot:CAMPEP_0172842236 /NCGR_PEP_ID=MMETSP1075-20121228/30574_1 /TAXON_ID=2916 /ORGANISM="Ceratium fusus, Strain PA161109" /LENGTH=432 /DNA_ID=CAMNT_0013686325 /DNA_START=126 /DNA_END=1427 /DNA_ORIENTATION=+
MTQTVAAEAPPPAPVATVRVAAEASSPVPGTTRAAAEEVEESDQQQRARPGGRGVASSAMRSWQRLGRCLGLTGSQSFQIRYPWHFKGCVVVVTFISASWVGNYALVVSPAIDAIDRQPCKDGTADNNQLAYNARMLLVYFIWFAVARMSLFLPCIASRVANVQSRTHGFCRTYCVHLVIRDGPLYIFVIGSMLFWFHLMQNPYCEGRDQGSDDTNLSMYRALRLYAIYSCLVSVLCMFLAYWHNKLLREAARRFPRQDRGAPPGTLEKLETRAYDAALFGDEEGKLLGQSVQSALARGTQKTSSRSHLVAMLSMKNALADGFVTEDLCALSSGPYKNNHPFIIHLAEELPEAKGIGAPVSHAAPAPITSQDNSPDNPTSREDMPGSFTIAADQESDDLEAAADEGPRPQPLAPVRRQMAHDDGQDDGPHTL